MAKKKLAPGFRFHPTDIELFKFYLKRKVARKKLPLDVISELDIYKYAPWDLPDKSCLNSRDLKWYFFCPREKKYASGARMNRATEFGYWKTTGKDRAVLCNNEVVGQIKTLIFHRGRAPKGDRTDWVMHEYRLEDRDLAERGVAQDVYVLCMIFQKDGLGPRNGAQYGAPFIEDEWDDDDDEGEVNFAEAAPSVGVFAPGPLLANNSPDDLIAPDTCASRTICIGSSSESCISDTLPSSTKAIPQVPCGDVPFTENPEIMDEDDILSMLALFKEDDPLLLPENSQNENHENPTTTIVDAVANCLDGNDIFADLGDIGDLAKYSLDPIPPSNDVAFLELTDLDSPINFAAEDGNFGHF